MKIGCITLCAVAMTVARAFAGEVVIDAAPAPAPSGVWWSEKYDPSTDNRSPKAFYVMRGGMVVNLQNPTVLNQIAVGNIRMPVWPLNILLLAEWSKWEFFDAYQRSESRKQRESGE